jgi:hypothetical protein
MNKKHLLLFSFILIIICSGFAVLGVTVAKDYAMHAKKAVPQPVQPTKKTENVKKENGKKENSKKENSRKPDYIMVATAYSDSGETKSRIHAGVGCVAVDRRIIPHGQCHQANL